MKWLPLACLIVLSLAAACADDDNEPEPLTGETAGDMDPPGEGQQAEGESDADIERLEHLQSLGYVSWDPGARMELRGVTRNEPGAAPGYNLFTDDLRMAFLMDMQGRIVYRWNIRETSRTHCEHVELLPQGNLVAVCVGSALKLLDPASGVIWSASLDTHHDVEPLDDGSFMTLFKASRQYKGRKVGFDGIARVSADGKVTEEWLTFDHLSELRSYHEPSPLDRPAGPDDPPRKEYDYYHTNTLEVLPETPLGSRDPRFRAGNYMVCLRNMNVILILDQNDYSVVWHWGAGELDLPHMPTMLENGNILVFDNGTYRGFTRILEIDPSTGDIVWEYQGDPPESFFSKWRGSAQRLENGNTLICESERGHVFEVTPVGDVVWEFWSPIFRRGKRKRIYRFERVSPRRVEPFLEDMLKANPFDPGEPFGFGAEPK